MVAAGMAARLVILTDRDSMSTLATVENSLKLPRQAHSINSYPPKTVFSVSMKEII